MYKTFTAATLEPASERTFYFVGVSTAQSSIRTVFPLWAEELGLGHVDFVGIDLPLHAPTEDYRRVVQFLKNDELSLGALVTSHKINLYHAAKDLFDSHDELAVMMGELSSISKRNGQLRGHAKDPITAGLSIDSLLPPHAWQETDRSAFVMGAGGSAIAMLWHLTRPERGTAVPREFVVSNRSTARLESLERIYADFGTDIPLRTVHTPEPQDNDAVLHSLPADAFVVNATGLGKDAPGSPLTDDAVFPEHAVAWDLNYRGDLVFLDQARSQAESRGVTVVDGWEYFIHGWTQVISEVFDTPIKTNGPEFDRLSELAAKARR